MKKVFALILALVMVFAMSSVAFADTIDKADGTADSSKNHDVTLVVNAVEQETKYYVELTWESLTFTYNFGSKAWNTTTHQYDISNAGWQADTENGQDAVGTGGSVTGVSSEITVENHSNAGIRIDAGYATSYADTGVNVTLDKYSATLDSADEDRYRSSDGSVDGPITTFTVTVGGTPSTTSTGAGGIKIGHITIVISPN